MEFLVKLLAVGGFAYVALGAFVFFMQPGMIYYPDIPTRNIQYTPASIGLDFQSVNFVTDDKVKLHAWYIPSDNPRATVLFCHGNAGNISHRLDSIQIFNRLGLNVFIFDYRGYGQSEGKMTEKGSYLDAEAAWKYLTYNKNILPGNIIIFGRSLGGAIASWLASHHEPAALIIESSFSSVNSMGKHFYPFLPVSLISRFSYNTAEYVKNVSSPVLIIHGPNDEIIPYSEGQKLFASASEPKRFFDLRGGHNDGFIATGSKYVRALDGFISDHLPLKTHGSN